ncbi:MULTISPECIES: UDP-N-acetylmuramoyl-tripeptide--D-alanyl-D-alanine ligase [Pseudanabaena]|uniref:UDP-N-acetylmuramoyl-tripeptide--D-alanyl-D-alanine ligase n=2 Tax=Pseudanabaena TaxID=1152 RepID=L8MWL0_9CYAN|nr:MULTISPECIES: UDP-N-acetylmuramoyl-tripeptide--D-alanyl-D-alanine ligase [Pseudanabaena]ELS30388.1 UDP-N-acetylmuramoyl-tripeptide--D-alanyl-D-alanine ligase [Pseudanabaena biceps PCC 7429]MDG3497334.1 UDP-N-acetylmuramoyl-tripeptide--D-alanyl-D-alanine ligase [Pseudanabaena catenata USMAC16]
MTCICTISQAIAITSATVANIDENTRNNIEIRGVISDSRKLGAGELFVALTGENFDGHVFVAAAIAQGAVAAIVSRQWANSDAATGLPLLAVDDTLTAYQELARWWRLQFSRPVISITGSVGKTTTKEMIASMLACYVAPDKQVHKSQANHNNDIGVAQTLLAIAPDQNDFVVVEMGMRGLGEIERLAKITLPTVSVITNVGTAHIGRLGSREAIAQAKCELLAETPIDGTAILNASNELLLEAATKVWQGKTITYGLGIGDVNGELINNKLHVEGLIWELPLPGRHNALNFLAGLAVLKALNLDWAQTLQGIGKLDLPFGRAQLYELPQDVMILDETYNASPEGMLAALRQLADMPAKRHWAVLGTMKELGAMSSQLHRQVGEAIGKLGIEGAIILTDGEADAILSGANGSLKYAIACQSYDDITQTLLQKVERGDRILFKASRSVGMDHVVKAFRETWH